VSESNRPLRVCLDAGHGGPDSGASRPPYYEKDLTLAIVRKIEFVLHDHQTIAILTRKGDTFITLSERCRIANVHDCDVFVSIHLNADPDPDGPGSHEARGVEVWHHSQSVKGKSLAEELLKGVRTCIPESRGTRSTTHLYVLKHTKMPSVLVEVGFVDSTHDVTRLAEPKFQLKLAQSIVESLYCWASLPLPPSISVLPPPRTDSSA
jgi:N-acetylmuramoyl-L-alanine amidase